MEDVELESFPGPRYINSNQTFMQHHVGSVGQSSACFEFTTMFLYHGMFSFPLNLTFVLFRALDFDTSNVAPVSF